MLDIGTRMKEFYEIPARQRLTRRTPVILRLDGRCFHTYTKGFKKPFDQRIIDAMASGALDVARDAQGCCFGYIQSDEVSLLLTDFSTLQTEAWFNYEVEKMVSCAASKMTVGFNQYMQGYATYAAPIKRWAEFDCRAFNIPREDVANYFLWRAQDWHRNSVSMAAYSVFSHKQLHKKSVKDMLMMLEEQGVVWGRDFTPTEKNGTFIYPIDGQWCTCSRIEPTYNAINREVDTSMGVNK